jgi:stage V sporulation protein D (sporulation-specific penicillin-binding protein)
MEDKNRRRRPPQGSQNAPPGRKRRRSLTPASVRRARRAVAMGVLMMFCIFGLVFRIYYIQTVHGEEYTRAAIMQEARRYIDRAHAIFEPVRGGFVDRNGQPITGTQQVFTLTLNAEALNQRYQRERQRSPNVDIRDEIFNAISLSLNIPRWELMEMVRTDENGVLVVQEGRRHRVLAREVEAEIAIPLSEMFAEINRNETSFRWYHDPMFAPQVIGFTRGDSTWGLELQYQAELTGAPGRSTWVLGETEIVPVRDGYTIVTTLDGEIQRLAQQYVDRTYIQHPSSFVGMIVMDPFTGEILAMAQAPTFSLEEPFNPEYFTDPILSEIWDSLDAGTRANQVMSLWRNYHTTRSSEPGSVFKPFVIAAAIEEGVISRNATFHCEGVRVIHEMEVRCWNDWGCGTMSLRRALYRSCNLAMATINREMGRDTFYRYRGYFGFGERTGIDLPGEESVSHPSVMYPYNMLNAVEMATSGMGQGFNATTIQLITGYAALINGGELLRPYLVSQIVDSNNTVVRQTEPQVVRRVISPETSDFIREEMRYVVAMRPGVGEHNSTAWRSYIPGHSIGGKTGTAQQGVRDDRNHNLSYISFMPVENPQFLVLFTIDHIEDDLRFAGDTVPPIVREFYLDLIRMRNIQPSDAEVDVTPELFGTPMPNFAGQRLTEVVRDIINMGTIGYQVVGGGTVISHTWPAAGHLMPETSPIIFYMNPDTRISERMITVPDVVGLRAEAAGTLLMNAGLPAPLLVTDTRTQSNDSNFNPRTAGAEPVGEGGAPPPAPAVYTVYQQFPAAGSEIEQGTQVMIRAR